MQRHRPGQRPAQKRRQSERQAHGGAGHPAPGQDEHRRVQPCRQPNGKAGGGDEQQGEPVRRPPPKQPDESVHTGHARRRYQGEQDPDLGAKGEVDDGGQDDAGEDVGDHASDVDRIPQRLIGWHGGHYSLNRIRQAPG